MLRDRFSPMAVILIVRVLAVLAAARVLPFPRVSRGDCNPAVAEPVVNAPVIGSHLGPLSYCPRSQPPPRGRGQSQSLACGGRSELAKSRSREGPNGQGQVAAGYPKGTAAFASAASASSAAVTSGRWLSSWAGPSDGWLDRGSWSAWRTLLTVFSALVWILITLVPARPSRWKEISMPRTRRNACARRNRPASAGGFLGQAVAPLGRPGPARSAPARTRSEALPDHVLRFAIICRTRAATWSASIRSSIAALQFAR